MLRILVFLIALLPAACLAQSNGVRQSGNVSPGHVACWTTSGIIQDCGTATQPFATLSKAQTAAVANNGDVVYLTGTVHLTATLAWAKADVSLIGLNSPSNNARARISATGATAFSPLVNVTGAGCSFINLGTFHGGFTGATGSQVCWNEAGGRNF